MFTVFSPLQEAQHPVCVTSGAAKGDFISFDTEGKTPPVVSADADIMENIKSCVEVDIQQIPHDRIFLQLILHSHHPVRLWRGVSALEVSSEEQTLRHTFLKMSPVS